LSSFGQVPEGAAVGSVCYYANIISCQKLVASSCPSKAREGVAKGAERVTEGVSEGRVSFLLPTLLVFYAAGAKKG